MLIVKPFEFCAADETVFHVEHCPARANYRRSVKDSHSIC